MYPLNMVYFSTSILQMIMIPSVRSLCLPGPLSPTLSLVLREVSHSLPSSYLLSGGHREVARCPGREAWEAMVAQHSSCVESVEQLLSCQPEGSLGQCQLLRELTHSCSSILEQCWGRGQVNRLRRRQRGVIDRHCNSMNNSQAMENKTGHMRLEDLIKSKKLRLG